MNDTTKKAQTTKRALYATVGAPVLTAKRVNEKFQDITSKLRDVNVAKDIRKEVDAWAAEGEKLVDRFGDKSMVEELSAKLDDIDVSGQVGKLREQLDDMLENWRKNFRPTGETVKVPVKEDKPATAKKPATKNPAAKATTAKKPAAMTTPTKKPATKQA